MFPKIWIFDTYGICLVVGIIAAFFMLRGYFKKINVNIAYRYDIYILGLITIVFGIFSATIAQYIINLIEGVNEFGSMTFYGGLIGGALFFIIIYELVIHKRYPNYSLMVIMIIAPACITIAHAFGRIGCFMAGCCHGIETESFLGVKFPHLDHKVYPTQLFESAFLFISSSILYILAIKKRFIYTMPIYAFSYSIWRFLIEFIRGDERGGKLIGLYPGQIISIAFFITAIVITILYYIKRDKWTLDPQVE